MDGIASSVPLIARPSFDRAAALCRPNMFRLGNGSCARSSVAAYGTNSRIAPMPIALNIPFA